MSVACFYRATKSSLLVIGAIVASIFGGCAGLAKSSGMHDASTECDCQNCKMMDATKGDGSGMGMMQMGKPTMSNPANISSIPALTTQPHDHSSHQGS